MSCPDDIVNNQYLRKMEDSLELTLNYDIQVKRKQLTTSNNDQPSPKIAAERNQVELE